MSGFDSALSHLIFDFILLAFYPSVFLFPFPPVSFSPFLNYFSPFLFFALLQSALNAQAALSQVRERQLASQPSAQSQPPELNRGPSNSQGSGSVPQPRPEHCEGAAAGLRGILLPPTAPAPVLPASIPAMASTFPSTLPASPLQSSVNHPALQEAEEAVLAKIHWASSQLQTAASLEASIQLCSLITSCAKSLRSLRDLNQ